jgi:hypothetical protein
MSTGATCSRIQDIVAKDAAALFLEAARQGLEDRIRHAGPLKAWYTKNKRDSSTTRQNYEPI